MKLMKWSASKQRLEKVYKPNSPDDWSGVLWANNVTKPPTDVPVCGWDGQICKPPKKRYTTIYAVLLTVVIIATGGLAIIFWQFR